MSEPPWHNALSAAGGEFTIGSHRAVDKHLTGNDSSRRGQRPPPVADVEKWTDGDEWDAAKAKWSKENAKWAECEQQATQQKLTGRDSWCSSTNASVDPKSPMKIRLNHGYRPVG